MKLSILIKRISTLVASALIVQSPISHAESEVPNWKFSANYAVQGEFGLYAVEPIDLRGTYYFDSVVSSAGPHAEFDFLNPRSKIGFRAVFEQTEGSNEPRNGFHFGFEYSLVNGRHVYQPEVQYTEHAGLETLGVGFDYTYLWTDTSRVTAGVIVNNEDLASGSSIATRANLGYRKLWQYNNNRALTAGFNLEGTTTENESRSFSILKLSSELNYYFGRRWGVGLALSHAESEIERFRTVGLDLSTVYYFNPNVGLDLGLGLAQDREGTLGGHSNLALTLRF